MLNSLQKTKCCLKRPIPATNSRKFRKMIRLTENDWRIFRRLQRKHKVSTEFLRYNLENIEKFIWFETWPRIVIKRYAVRKENRVFIIYYRLRRVLFDQSNRKMFKRMRQNIKQWSKRIVAWQKEHLGIKEYVEEVVYEETTEREKIEPAAKADTTSGSSEDVSKRLKQQLELLKNGRRPQPLIATNSPAIETPINVERENEKCANDKEECTDTILNKVEKQKSDSNSIDDVRKKLKEQLDSIKARRDNTAAALDIIQTTGPRVREEKLGESSIVETAGDWQINLESTPEKQITTQENLQPVKQLDTDEKTEKSHTEPSTQQTGKHKTGLNFLDMLMCKVSGSSINSGSSSVTKAKDSLARMPSSSSLKEGYQHHHEHSMDSTDEFLGFDDCERIPGMLMTPIVPHSTKNNKNSVFVSESLNEYMRLNDLETNYSIDEDKSIIKSKIFARDMEGLMTPKTKPPHIDMPAVPENLLKFRTVAERKQYLQKFSKNYRLAIINNEASIYRELQRRMRTQKVKSASQIVAQSVNSAMSFTRNGWNAASFINTEFNKYYYQILDVDHGTYKVRLRGARGNNDEFHKTPYVSRAIKPPKYCPHHCPDERVWQYLKPIKTIAEKTKKLNKGPLPAVFKPCPLSHKTFQKPLDDDTAALLLAGGSMAVVRMPTVELEVFPEYGKPLHEIAKRYLQYILPHHDISREWAEFSVSTLQQPKTLKEVEQAAAKTFSTPDLRKSYTFVIPYLNDRNHILVRRVVDRSEKLDQSFEKSLEDRELVPKTDFSFRQNLDQSDDILLTCADVVSDMINTVAISCSENSFIKTDPDGVNAGEAVNSSTKLNNKQDSTTHFERPAAAGVATVAGNIKKHKKQNSLLMELKRLNATIIDAAVKPESDKKSCSKEYCQMGCICVSLNETAPMREHCGKTKCMLECTCKTTAQSRIMRLETDGRTLTTEDAFMLRRKATARLARMEKEFTSTVVLTENETLLINETNNDKKRRCTKAPKRYEDFTDNEDEQRRNSPKKAALTTIDNEKHLAIEIKEVHEPVYVRDSILEQLKHCTVNLVPLQEMDNLAPWCMVHNLYKCFCKGRAVEGKPMIIEKEEVNTTIEHEAAGGDQKLEYDYNVKAKYTFDKVEKKRKQKLENNSDAEEEPEEEDMAAMETYDEQQNNNSGEEVEEKDKGEDLIKKRKRRKREKIIEKAEELVAREKLKSDEDDADEVMEDEYTKDDASGHIEKKSRRSLHEVRKRFYQAREDSCRRHIPTPRRMFLYCNRRRRLSILKYIKDNENEQTRLLLNEHVMRSVYYHKIDVENHKKNNLKEQMGDVGVQQQQPPANEVNVMAATSNKTPKKFLLVNEVVDLLEDDEDQQPSGSNSLIKDRDENTQLTSTSSTRSCSSFEKITPDTEPTNHFQICSSGGVITVKKCPKLTEEKHNEQESTKVTTAKNITLPETSQATESAVEAIKLPKISSCFSLNVKANTQKSATTTKLNEEQSLDFTSATSVHSAAFAQAQNQQTTKAQSSSVLGPNISAKDGSIAFNLDMDNENVRDVYNSVIKTMNSLVSKKMQDIDCALQRESHIIPTPNPDILCIMKWCNFLDAFCEGFAYVWQVKMKEDTFFVVTIRNMMPMLPGAMGIVNINALKPDKMPLMGKMLLQKFRTKETEKLAVVMQGKKSHWVVKGFLKADPSLACNKPTPETHPSLTKKINVLCSLLVKQRQRENKNKDKLPTNQWTGGSNTQKSVTAGKITKLAAAATAPSPQVTPKITQIMSTTRITIGQQHINPSLPQQATQQQFLNPQINQHTTLLTQQLQQQPQSLITTQPLTSEIITTQNSLDITSKSNKQPNIEPGKIIAKINSRKRKVDMAQSNNLLKMDSYSKMSSNIEFRSVTQSDINEIFLPELHKLDHKWLVLDLHNDFSHIFVPDFRDLVSLDRIQKVINFAKQKSKIVKLQFFQNAPFDAFVTPKSGRKIYFGPLTMDMKAPTLILLQSVDGQMMLRELYQLQHNIVKKPEEKTKAFWLIHRKGKTQFEINVNVNGGTVNANAAVETGLSNSDNNKEIIATTAALPNNDVGQNIEEDDDDEDCMIIDDDEDETEEIMESFPNTSRIDNLNSLTTQITNLPGVPSIMTPQGINSSIINTSASQSLLKVPNTNTIIKPINPPSASSSSSSPVVINVPAMSVTNKPLPILTLPPNTIITGITPNATSSLEMAASTPLINLPTNAVITGIATAPPEAPYSSTIFITSSTPSNSPAPTTTPITTTTSTASISQVTKTVSTTRPAQINELNNAGINKKPMNIARQSSFEAATGGGIKRRRISLFCSNKFDKMSENLAVDAIIKKILPHNAEDIQVNPLTNVSDEEVQRSPQSILTNEVVATVGSTKISKLRSTETNALQTSMEMATNSATNTGSSTAKPKAPIVFDVNFMDDGDEPTASILIKPTKSTAAATTEPIQITNNKTINSKANTATNSSLIREQLMSSTTTTTVLPTNTTHPVYKNLKLPTLFNATTIANTKSTTTVTISRNKSANTTNPAHVTTKRTLINSLLCTKQPDIEPTFSTPRPIAPKINPRTSPCSPIDNDNSNPFPFRRSSVSLKVQKIMGSSSATVNTQTTVKSPTNSTIVSTNPMSASALPSTLTVQQVQDMLNKPAISVTSNKTTTSLSSAVNSSANMHLPPPPQQQHMPSIKATITPAKPSPISLTSTIISPAASTAISLASSSSPSTCTGSSAVTSSTTHVETANSTLTISKVQSFGSPQKPEKSPAPTNTPAKTQIVINDSNDQVIPTTPPAHIQYGYIVSATHSNQKFVAKRVADEFYVKVPSVGILKLQGLAAVNNYLNKYISKTGKESHNTTAIWQFVAASKAVQMQNHQKSLLVRKTKNPSAATGGASKNINTPMSVTTVCDSSLDEPILIED